MQSIFFLIASAVIISSILVVIIAFQKDLFWGIVCLLIPIAQPIFVIIYFREFKTVATIYFISIPLIIIAGRMNKPNEPQMALYRISVLNRVLSQYKNKDGCCPVDLQELLDKKYLKDEWEKLVASYVPEFSYRGYNYEYRRQSCVSYELYAKPKDSRREELYSNEHGIIRNNDYQARNINLRKNK